MGGNAVILYFSGTGNSRYAAETLAHLTDDIAVNMTSLWPADGPTAMHIGNNETLGVVFPVYAWAAPMIVSETLARIAVEPGAYIYAVCTCGDDAGCAIEKLQRQIPLCAAWSLQMPNNYLPMYDVDDPALMKRKLTAAKPRLAAIAEQIRGKRHVFDVRKSAGALFKTWVIHPFFERFAMSTKPFYAEDSCTHCGLCEKNCPAHAIQIENGKPRWKKTRCIQCQSCINRCPVRAIQYGEATKSRGRYVFPEKGTD